MKIIFDILAPVLYIVLLVFSVYILLPIILYALILIVAPMVAFIIGCTLWSMLTRFLRRSAIIR